jgi:hypothetical protein
MILEEQRFLHEDLERLEQGISDRTAEEPRQVSNLHHALCFACANVPFHRFGNALIVTIKSLGFLTGYKTSRNG